MLPRPGAATGRRAWGRGRRRAGGPRRACRGCRGRCARLARRPSPVAAAGGGAAPSAGPAPPRSPPPAPRAAPRRRRRGDRASRGTRAVRPRRPSSASSSTRRSMMSARVGWSTFWITTASGRLREGESSAVAPAASEVERPCAQRALNTQCIRWPAGSARRTSSAYAPVTTTMSSICEWPSSSISQPSSEPSPQDSSGFGEPMRLDAPAASTSAATLIRRPPRVRPHVRAHRAPARAASPRSPRARRRRRGRSSAAWTLGRPPTASA